jgi:hypothetical protein
VEGDRDYYYYVGFWCVVLMRGRELGGEFRMLENLE